MYKSKVLYVHMYNLRSVLHMNRINKINMSMLRICEGVNERINEMKAVLSSGKDIKRVNCGESVESAMTDSESKENEEKLIKKIFEGKNLNLAYIRRMTHNSSKWLLSLPLALFL